MRFRITIAQCVVPGGWEKDVDSLLDLLTIWKNLQNAGMRSWALICYELNDQYEWVTIDAEDIYRGMQRLFFGNEARLEFQHG